jgi:Fe-S-cluster-containing hydrogenase component 2
MNKESTTAKTSGGETGRKGTEDTGIVFDMPSCGGCRTCELACSFHHTQEFSPSASSLKVLDKDGGPGYRVWLSAGDGGRSPACDGCEGLDVPLCMEYCKEMDDLGKILLDFEERKVEKKK